MSENTTQGHAKTDDPGTSGSVPMCGYRVGVECHSPASWLVTYAYVGDQPRQVMVCAKHVPYIENMCATTKTALQ